MRIQSSKNLTKCTLEFLNKLIMLYKSGKINIDLFEDCSRLKIKFLEQQSTQNVQFKCFAGPIEETLRMCYEILSPNSNIQ